MFFDTLASKKPQKTQISPLCLIFHFLPYFQFNPFPSSSSTSLFFLFPSSLLSQSSAPFPFTLLSQSSSPFLSSLLSHSLLFQFSSPSHPPSFSSSNPGAGIRISIPSYPHYFPFSLLSQSPSFSFFFSLLLSPPQGVGGQRVSDPPFEKRGVKRVF